MTNEPAKLRLQTYNFNNSQRWPMAYSQTGALHTTLAYNSLDWKCILAKRSETRESIALCSAHVREWRAVKGEKGAGEMGWVVKPLCRWL